MRRRLTVALLLIAFAAPTDDLMALIENTVAPVVETTSISNVARTQDRMCFDWSLKKHRAPRQLFFLFYGHGANATDRHMLGLCVRSDDGSCRPLRTALAAPAGATRVRTLCAFLPPELAAAPAATVEGYSIYEGFMGLWRLPYRIGPVRTSPPPQS